MKVWQLRHLRHLFYYQWEWWFFEHRDFFECVIVIGIQHYLMLHLMLSFIASVINNFKSIKNELMNKIWSKKRISFHYFNKEALYKVLRNNPLYQRYSQKLIHRICYFRDVRRGFNEPSSWKSDTLCHMYLKVTAIVLTVKILHQLLYQLKTLRN